MENLEITKELLMELIEEKQIKKLREIFDEFNIVNLAEIVQELETSQMLFIFKILKKELGAQLFSYFDSDNQARLVDVFTSNEIQDILTNLYSDDMTDFIEDMPANIVKKIIMAATQEQRATINSLMSYPDDSAGSIMGTEFVELEENDTITQAVKKIKKQGKVAETISYCYVTNNRKRLVGAIALRDILFEPVNDLISEHMENDIISVTTSTDQEEVARTFKKYDILVLPVVNDDNCLIGIITSDDIIDVFEEEVTEDIQKMAAIRPINESYLDTSFLTMVRSRLPWLLILMISATLTGGILAGFEEALGVIPALAAFVPMIMGTAGNAGSQASVMVIRGIAVDDLNVKDTIKVLWKETQVSLICGAILFVVSVIRIMVLPPSVTIDIALVVSLALVLSLFVAKVVGGLLPLLSLIIKQDPAAMAAPLITTVVDALALIIYFNLCRCFLGI